MADVLEKYKDMLNSGELYDCYDEELLAYQYELVQRMNGYNSTPDTPEGHAEREALLREALGTYGENLVMLPPVHSNWGLKNVHVGKDCFFNFNCGFVDDADIFFGDDCLIGPGCQFVTAEHPVAPEPRRKKMQYNKQIHVGNNVWFGAGAIVLPGVTIGDNSIVAAGAVVTKDVPENVIVAGVPARILREITEEEINHE